MKKDQAEHEAAEKVAREIVKVLIFVPDIRDGEPRVVLPPITRLVAEAVRVAVEKEREAWRGRWNILHHRIVDAYNFSHACEMEEAHYDRARAEGDATPGPEPIANCGCIYHAEDGTPCEHDLALRGTPPKTGGKERR